MEYYPPIKENAFEAVLMNWLKLECIIQISPKVKHQNCNLTHIYIEFRNMARTTLNARQRKRHRCKEQSFGRCMKK